MAFEKYSYNGANALADYDLNNNATARYAMNGVDGLLYVQRGMKKYFYHTNHLGSVVAITDEDGDVVNRYLYTDSWGNFKLSCPSVNKGKPCIPNRYIYTGREWDADLALYYYRARWYDPDTKRFTQEDEYLELEMFRYVMNNPLLYTDSLGTDIDQRAVEYGTWGAAVGSAIGFVFLGGGGAIGGGAVCSAVAPGAGTIGCGAIGGALGAAKGTALGGAAGAAVGAAIGSGVSYMRGERGYEKGRGDDPYWQKSNEELNQIRRNGTKSEKARAENVLKHRRHEKQGGQSGKKKKPTCDKPE